MTKSAAEEQVQHGRVGGNLRQLSEKCGFCGVGIGQPCFEVEFPASNEERAEEPAAPQQPDTVEKATARPWRVSTDVWDRKQIMSDADSQAIAEWLREHPNKADKTFRGVTIADGFGPKYNGSGDEFGPHEIISAEEAEANAELIARAVNAYSPARDAAVIAALDRIRTDSRIASIKNGDRKAALDSICEIADAALRLAEEARQ